MKNIKIGFLPAICIVVANMVGVGVFTSLGFQLSDLSDYRSVIAIWIMGGVLALLGSYCYAELSATYPQSGGEYHFLRVCFGPQVGFLSGWTSAIVGFAAPIAASAHAFSVYFTHVIPWQLNPVFLSATLIIVITALHTLSIRAGLSFQVYFTVGKVLLMIFFIAYGFFHTHGDMPKTTRGGDLFMSDSFSVDLLGTGFWIGLIFVSYAYSGWNASAYMIEDIRDPTKNVPRSILWGTLLVICLYTLINFVFMKSAPVDELRGRQDVADVSAFYLFGKSGSRLISGLISFFLVSTISSMIIVGPRVIRRISQDYPSLSYFAADANGHVPQRAILLQGSLALMFLFTSSFESILTGIGFILTIFTTLTALALIILRIREPDILRPLKTPFYPLIPLSFIAFNGWILYQVLVSRTGHVLAAMGFLLAGFIFHGMIRRMGKTAQR